MPPKKFPLIISAPHAKSTVPEEYAKRMLLSEEDLWRCSDPFTKETAQHPRAHSIHIAKHHRLLGDLNRAPTPETAFRQKDFYGNKIWREGEEPDELEKTELLHKNWFTHYDEIEKSVRELIHRGHKKILFIDHHNTLFDHPIHGTHEYMPAIVISNYGSRNRGARIRNRGQTSAPAGAMKIFQKAIKEETGFAAEINQVYRGGYSVEWVGQIAKELDPKITVYGIQLEYNLGFIHNPLSGYNDHKALALLRDKLNKSINKFAECLKL